MSHRGAIGSSPMANAGEPGALSRAFRRLPRGAGVRQCLSDHWRSIGSLSKTCLVRFDNNKYSVEASAVGRPVEVRAYADRIELRQGEPLCAIGSSTMANAWWAPMPSPVGSNQWRLTGDLRAWRNRLQPVALRAGAGPQARCAEERCSLQALGAAGRHRAGARAALRAAADGDRQMVEILGAVARATGCPRSRPPAPRRCARASIPPTLSRRQRSSNRWRARWQLLGPMADNGFDPEHASPDTAIRPRRSRS